MWYIAKNCKFSQHFSDKCLAKEEQEYVFMTERLIQILKAIVR